MFDDATVRAAERFAARMKVETAALLAVAEIESAGQVFARVDGRNEPLIRFEGHYFDRRLSAGQRARARKAGLAHPSAGRVKNPRSQAARWKLLERAVAIDSQAALESVSWGIGQVMGAHWDKLGFASVQDLVALARKSAAGQLELMVRYIERFGLVDELQRLDFTGFARGYNGPGFAKYRYHTKMAAAYRRLSGAPAVSAARGMLRMGSRGAAVRDLQALLVRAGYAVQVDGDYGPATKQAVMEFQRAQGIDVDGVVGPQTKRALDALRRDPEEQPGHVGPLETEEAKQGGGAVVTGAGVETARQTIEQAAEQTSWVPGLEWLSAILSVIAVLLVLGGLAWFAWGWWKSRKTDEGDIAADEAGAAMAFGGT